MKQPSSHGAGRCMTRFLLLLGTPVLLGLAGCGDSQLGVVSGTVTLDGRPLDQGLVVFEDREKGVSVNAAIEPDGSFVVKTYDQTGLPPGEYMVAVKPGQVGDGETPLVGGPMEAQPGGSVQIPARYGSTRTSGLTATVTPGANNVPLELSSKP